MNLDYLRSRIQMYHQARSNQERDQLVYNLALHLNIIRSGQALSQEQRGRVFTQLQQMGLQVTGFKKSAGKQLNSCRRKL